jgi:hypothetical protein
LALDAIINAIIHRQYGESYSSMMSTYYGKARGWKKLLRPMKTGEQRWYNEHRFAKGKVPQWVHAWGGLYQGRLIADDIEALVRQLGQAAQEDGPKRSPFKIEKEEITAEDIDDLLGDHKDMGRALPEKLQNALDEAMRQMNGSGIWRDPRSRGIGANAYEALCTAKNEPLLRWKRKTAEVLKRHLQPDRRSPATEYVQTEYRIPVLSPSDRRAFVRATWAPFLPEASWRAVRPERSGVAQVYLDVSGSMDPEMPQIIALLGHLSRFIRRPFWAFSDVVAPAVIENGQLKTITSGGTSISCVLEHLVDTKPPCAVVVTDGYIEQVEPALVAKASSTKIHALVTRDGSPVALRRVGIPYTQLDRVPG